MNKPLKQLLTEAQAMTSNTPPHEIASLMDHARNLPSALRRKLLEKVAISADKTIAKSYH